MNMTSQHGADEAIWIERLNIEAPRWRDDFDEVYEACAALLPDFVFPPNQELAYPELDVESCDFGEGDENVDNEHS